MELVRQIAHRIHSSLPSQHTFDDLVQDGMLGLVEAAGLYDPALNDSFTAFAFPRIRGRIIDGVRRFGSRNQHGTRACNRVERAIRAVEQTTQSPARLREIADHLGIDIEETGRLMQTGQPIDPDEFNDETLPYQVVISSRPTDPEITAEYQGTMDQLHAALVCIKKKPRLVFVAYFIEGKNLRDISREMDLSPSRVSQLKNMAVESIRSALAMRGIT